MIKVDEIKNTDYDENTYWISAFADTKAEVVPGAVFVGLPKNAKLEMGSKVLTADGYLGLMRSDGVWSWH